MRPPEAARGSRLAVAIGRPFDGPQPERIEQHAPRIVRELLPRTPGDQATEQRGGTAAIGPFHARLTDDRKRQDVAIAIGRRLHPDFAIARIAIGECELVPFRPHRHAERVSDRDAIAARLARQVGVFGELVVEPGLRRRHLAVGQRDAIEHADHALGHRAQIVQHRRAERDRAERGAHPFILAHAVILEQDAAAARHQQRMQAGHAAVALHLSQACGEVAIGCDGTIGC